MQVANIYVQVANISLIYMQKLPRFEKEVEDATNIDNNSVYIATNVGANSAYVWSDSLYMCAMTHSYIFMRAMTHAYLHMCAMIHSYTYWRELHFITLEQAYI